MRILIVGDSHVRGMGGALELLDKNVATMTILVGRRTSIVRSAYEDKLVSAQRFSPEVVVVHCGHNDIVMGITIQHPLIYCPILMSCSPFVRLMRGIIPRRGYFCPRYCREPPVIGLVWMKR
jgi:hypothetical protein